MPPVNNWIGGSMKGPRRRRGDPKGYIGVDVDWSQLLSA